MSKEIKKVSDIVELYGTAKDSYNRAENDRKPILERSIDCAKLTIPSVSVDASHKEADSLPTPYQSLGSILVNNLSSKLILSLLPPNTPFFRLLPSEAMKTTLEQQGIDISQLETQLVSIESEIQRHIEREALRIPIFEALKALIITGNSLLYKTETGMKTYRLGSYVVKRDYAGDVIEIITKGEVSVEALPEELVKQIDLDEDTKKVHIYNRLVRNNNKFYAYQEVDEILIDDSLQEFDNIASTPFMPLRWTSVNGENYGRGLVEQYLGDYRTLEAYSQIIIEATELSTRIVFGRNPGSLVRPEDLMRARTGDVIEGNLDRDISTLKLNKNPDFSIALKQIGDLTARLEKAFLVAGARDSERTTATEIRYLANDLEKSLGGIYSILSLELQKPLAQQLLNKIDTNLFDLGFEVVIVTGQEALGRNTELEKLMQFNQIMQGLGNPEAIIQRLNIDSYISTVANSLNLNVNGLIKSKEQLEAEQQQAQKQQMQSQVMEQAIQQQQPPQEEEQ